MPKTRELTIAERAAIVTLHKEGYVTREISNKLEIPQTTVSYTVRRFRTTGNVESKQRKGRPRSTTKRDDSYIQTISKRNRRLTATEILATVNKSLPKPISKTTVRDRLRQAGLRGCVAVKKPLLRKVNKVKRLQWAREHIKWSIRDWKKTLWSDESKFVVFGSNRKAYVRRRPGEKLMDDCLTASVKHGGGSVMVWGCFGGDNVGDLIQINGKMDKFQYKEILQNHAMPSGIRLIGRGFMFQHDNDPKHTSKLCTSYLDEQHRRRKLNLMKWPPQSPDLNPIELLWDHLDREVRKTCPTSCKDLFEKLENVWKNIGTETLDKLIDRMPKLCSAIIKRHGGHIDESVI